MSGPRPAHDTPKPPLGARAGPRCVRHASPEKPPHSADTLLSAKAVYRQLPSSAHGAAHAMPPRRCLFELFVAMRRGSRRRHSLGLRASPPCPHGVRGETGRTGCEQQIVASVAGQRVTAPVAPMQSRLSDPNAWSCPGRPRAGRPGDTRTEARRVVATGGIGEVVPAVLVDLHIAPVHGEAVVPSVAAQDGPGHKRVERS